MKAQKVSWITIGGAGMTRHCFKNKVVVVVVVGGGDSGGCSMLNLYSAEFQTDVRVYTATYPINSVPGTKVALAGFDQY